MNKNRLFKTSGICRDSSNLHSRRCFDAEAKEGDKKNIFNIDFAPSVEGSWHVDSLTGHKETPAVPAETKDTSPVNSIYIFVRTTNP